MEDMTRLAMVEQSIGDTQKFKNLLLELVCNIKRILNDPQDPNLKIIDSELIKSASQHTSFTDYLEYLGFEQKSNQFKYPTNQSLNKLKLAQTSLERKLFFCLGPNNMEVDSGTKSKLPVAAKPNYTAANILTTNNEFLLKIQTLLNTMIQYEDDELQDYARSTIPLLTLQFKAVDRMREQQKKIKSGEFKGEDMPFDTALLMELVGWFKHEFFKWVDEPECDKCYGATVFVRKGSMTTKTETCLVEVYRCPRCDVEVKFPRYNDPRVLLSTRRGRCGEWANAFTLMCRSLNYDTRYIYDTTDHVWCEVFDYESNTWVHVDPCEGKINAPLMYSHGWKKKISYVIATSRDDIQDVTWRYTTNHKEVRSRRRLCSEHELVSAIMALRQHRQSQVSPFRRAYLVKRGLLELVELMVEKQPSDYESSGRISGSVSWRATRGEISTNPGHIFLISAPGVHTIQYYTASDRYRVVGNRLEKEVAEWGKGVWSSRYVMRKVERDWKMTYLAREEGECLGQISWKLMVDSDKLQCRSLSVRLTSALYENGNIDWTVQFDDQKPVAAKFGENPVEFVQPYKEVVITAELSGGRGGVAWQHAQLFRQRVDDRACAFEIVVQVKGVK